ncbi:putative glycerol kinase 5 [Collichthys lucidus]|uniref:Glycerol kinase 5 n=1 Tax=Collichthys lucidus TaxID=240159 RepID=A0A4U5UZ47_COLLU|nr:putative glycerol kinase 5 [Collichthys lucidus]
MTKRNGFNKETFILSVDVGTTSIRCHIYDKEAQIRGSCITKVVPLYPEVGHVEMDPDALWTGFITVIKGAVQGANIHMSQIEALGISTQRATFTTWDRRTGVPFHNFISWQDQRAADLVKSWNRSCTLKVIHGAMKVVYLVTRQKRSLAASSLFFSTQHVTFRLVWALTHYKQVRQAVAEGNCCFGTIDTWLLFKLTNGRIHATDYSNASATGIFDSYQMADQQAAMFGECCFDVGDVKITMGTGTFMNINTGSKPHTSVAGLYPLVGWKIGSEVVYLAEGNAADTGTAIKWAQELELFSDVQDTCAMAYSVSDSNGVCFVPSFSGLQAPLNDPKACASFMGLKPSTTKSHLVRAILESVAFRNKQLYELMLRETHIPITKIRVDGGVSSNDFVMQLTASLFGRKVTRPKHLEMSCLGAAFVAGLGAGFWRTREELKKLHNTDDVFLPRGPLNNGCPTPNGEYNPILQSWERALRRSMNWYKP